MSDSETYTKRRAYFVLDQLVFLVGAEAAPDVNAFNAWLESLDDPDTNARVECNTEQAIVSFHAPNADTDDGLTSPRHLLVAQLRWKREPLNEDERDREVIQWVNRVNEFRGQPTDMSGTHLLIASPNWLFVAAQGQLVGGGPGGLPVAVPSQPPPTAAEYMLHFPVVAPPSSNEDDRGQQSPTPCAVDVVIFDTVPLISHSEWETVQSRSREHTLLQTLHDKLHIIRNGDTGYQVDIPAHSTRYGYTHEPEYDISNHGLFIAGLIHSAAPDAEIYLAQVLNRYGAGTLVGITGALAALANGSIIRRDSGRPLIVNLSLTIGVERGLTIAQRAERLTPDYVPHENEIVKQLRSLLETLVAVNDRFKSSGVAIFAAAGNDGDDALGSPKYQARYPAAFTEVIGVGALASSRPVQANDQGIQLSDGSVRQAGGDAFYSNQADRPEEVGIKVFGGEAEVTTGQTALGNKIYRSRTDTGLLGIFLGQPASNTGETGVDNPEIVAGWARWSGTSFATGVAVAALAKLVCDGTARLPLTVTADRTGVRDILGLFPNGGMENDRPVVIVVRQGDEEV